MRRGRGGLVAGQRGGLPATGAAQEPGPKLGTEMRQQRRPHEPVGDLGTGSRLAGGVGQRGRVRSTVGTFGVALPSMISHRVIGEVVEPTAPASASSTTIGGCSVRTTVGGPRRCSRQSMISKPSASTRLRPARRRRRGASIAMSHGPRKLGQRQAHALRGVHPREVHRSSSTDRSVSSTSSLGSREDLARCTPAHGPASQARSMASRRHRRRCRRRVVVETREPSYVRRVSDVHRVLDRAVPHPRRRGTPRRGTARRG